MWDRKTVDIYHLNLFCKCLDCKKRNTDGEAQSCKAYPEEYGIPPEIWNAQNGYCEYFEPKKEISPKIDTQ